MRSILCVSQHSTGITRNSKEALSVTTKEIVQMKEFLSSLDMDRSKS